MTQTDPADKSWSLNALVELPSTAISEVVAGASKLPGAVVVPRWQIEQWFPPPVRARYAKTTENANVVIGDAVRRVPTQFVAVDKSPLTEGYVAVIPDEPFVYLTLHTF